MFRKIIAGLVAVTLLSTPALAQITTSGSPRVQGTGSPTLGAPVNVLITDGSGNAVTSEVPTGTAGTPNVAVVTVQGITNGTVVPISAASLPLPSGAATSAAQSTAATTLSTIATNTTSIATAANQTTQITDLGGVTETAPATDTASSGLNGRLQRVSQRLTSLLPAGTTAAASSLGVALATEDVARQGIITETAPATDTASSGINGRLQRVAQRLTTINTTLGTPLQAGTAQLPASLGIKTAANSISIAPASDASFGIAGSATTLGDGQATSVYQVLDPFHGDFVKFAVRPEMFNGATFDRARGDVNGTVVQVGLSSTSWTYANGATGILSNTTTAVTIKTAAGVSVRNFIDSCQINTTAFTTAGPLAIRDGAAGTVIWAIQVPTTGFLNPISVVFATPLRSTANTLLEVVTTTANTTGTVWVNCQGHTGS